MGLWGRSATTGERTIGGRWKNKSWRRETAARRSNEKTRTGRRHGSAIYQSKAGLKYRSVSLRVFGFPNSVFFLFFLFLFSLETFLFFSFFFFPCHPLVGDSRGHHG